MPHPAKTDVVLIGAGIMSATLGAMLRRLEPDWSITVIERLDGAAAESSGTWHNAGTGHTGVCELNYTPAGASTAVSDMFDVLARCFPGRYQSWLPGIKEMVPSLGTELSREPALFAEVWSWGSKVLRLDPGNSPGGCG